MPTRLLREGILTSVRVDSLGCEAEVFYRRLISVADDYGRFHGHPALLRAALYPLKLDVLVDAQMTVWLDEVVQAGLVRVYEAEGRQYVQILRFRQQLRAKSSKYPAPPGLAESAEAHAQQMRSTCLASAHLGGGVVEVVDEGAGGGGGGGETGAPPPPAAASARDGDPPVASAAPPARERIPTPNGATPPMHVQIAVRLREAGVNITSTHPLAHAWAARGLTVAHALEAVALARMRKSAGRIPPNYLAPIVEDMLNRGSSPHTASSSVPAWWSSEAATLGKGHELGLNPRPGEAMAEYRARLSAAMANRGPREAQPPPPPAKAVA